jgi:hypothetical protein
MPGSMAVAVRRPATRWIVLAVTALVVVFVLPPLVNINRYQHRIAESISRSLGRQVHIDQVRMRLLPLPGFELSGFAVEEDPQFGAEPILHSDSVVAYLRLLSLWRGRLEVSRIHFDDASLNLVRDPSGVWNFASVLVQAAHIPNAPTGQRHAGSAPRFPYIEAENTRINFKEGNEKQPLSFLNSDLTVSLTSDNAWEFHFRAQPVRTDLDLYLSDTGTLRIDGTVQRAASLGQMPLNLNVDWSGVPLGQLSRLTTGSDIGWRGGLEVRGVVGGTADHAQFNTTLKVAGFHRSEFTPAHALDMEASCRASFSRESRSLEDIACLSPVGDGSLQLQGSIAEVQTHPQADLALAIQRVPASAVLTALQVVRNGLASGMQAAGALNGQLLYTSQEGRANVLGGDMSIDSLSLTAADAKKPLVVGPVRVRAQNTGLLLQPVRLAMGAPVPVSLDGHFTPEGFDLHVGGSAALTRLKVLGRPFALLGGAGTAALDLDLRGPWLLPVPDVEHPVVSSIAEGSIAIRNAELATSYLSQPLKVAAAQAILSPGQVSWTNASFSMGKLEAQGTLEYPTVCPADTKCPARFSLNFPTLDVAGLQSALLGTSEGGELLRQLIKRIDRHPAQWPSLSGTVRIGALSAGKMVVHDAVGTLDISGSTMKISALTGRVASGAMHLAGTLDASGNEPDYQWNVQLTNASPSALAGIFDEHWGSGSANISAQLEMSGYDTDDLAKSTTGTVRWDWTRGGLTTDDPLPVAAQPFAHFDQWNAEGTVGDRSIAITHSLLDRGQEAIPLTGTISFDRELDLKGGSPAHLFTVTGTLQHPEAKTATEEVAN